MIITVKNQVHQEAILHAVKADGNMKATIAEDHHLHHPGTHIIMNGILITEEVIVK